MSCGVNPPEDAVIFDRTIKYDGLTVRYTVAALIEENRESDYSSDVA